MGMGECSGLRVKYPVEVGVDVTSPLIAETGGLNSHRPQMSLVPVGMVAIPLLLMVGVIGFFHGRMFRLR